MSRDSLLQDLKDNVLEISIEYENTRKFIRCTLREDILPKSYSNIKETVRKFHETNPSMIAAWDINYKRWDSFHVDTIKYAQDVNENY